MQTDNKENLAVNPTQEPKMTNEQIMAQLNIEMALVSIRQRTMDLMKDKFTFLHDNLKSGIGHEEDTRAELNAIIERVIKLPA